MHLTTVSSRQFNQEVSRIKLACQKGPILITHRGKPSHVLLTIEDYESLLGEEKSIADLLAMESDPFIEFEPPKLK